MMTLGSVALFWSLMGFFGLQGIVSFYHAVRHDQDTDDRVIHIIFLLWSLLNIFSIIELQI